MTEMIPLPLRACPTVRPMRTRHDLVMRLHDALHEHGGFTARVPPGPLVITYSGYAVATDAARVQLPAHATSAVLSRAVGMPLSRHPHHPGRPRTAARRPHRPGTRGGLRPRVTAWNTDRMTDHRPRPAPIAGRSVESTHPCT